MRTQLAAVHNGPDALHLPTKAGGGLCLPSEWQLLDSISLLEGHLSCPTKAKTKAVSATASPTWSVVVRGGLALSCAQTQGSPSGSSGASGTKASSIYRGNGESNELLLIVVSSVSHVPVQ